MTTVCTATVLGSPRIGPHRELKKAVEAYWAGRLDSAGLDAAGKDLRRQTWTALRDAGLDSIPVNTFSYYDHVLDTAAMLGALPERVAGIDSELDRYFAAARGNNDTVAPLEMTKWFDTNYHYLVPEISPSTTFSLDASKVIGELAEARELGIAARPVVVGPVTFLLLSKAVGSEAPLLDRLNELVPLYADLLGRLADAGAQWVQIDEPALVADRSPEEIAAAKGTYDQLSALQHRPAILLASYFGSLGDALPALASTGVEGLAVDLVAGSDSLASVPELTRKLVVAGVVDGRNIWRTDRDTALASLGSLLGSSGSLAVSTSCSLLHVAHRAPAHRDSTFLAAQRHRRSQRASAPDTAPRRSHPCATPHARRGSSILASDRGRSPAADRRVAQSALAHSARG